MQRKYPSDLPISPLRRFYVKDPFILDIENGEAWVEAETAVEAAMMAKILWKPWFTGFSHDVCIDPRTGQEERFDHTMESALDHLSQVVEEKEQKKKRTKGEV